MTLEVSFVAEDQTISRKFQLVLVVEKTVSEYNPENSPYTICVSDLPLTECPGGKGGRRKTHTVLY